MPADMHRTLTELQDLIEQRAAVLAGQAVREGPVVGGQGRASTRRPGPACCPGEQVRTIAAYRGRHASPALTRSDPAPSGQGQRLDYQRADTAARRARAAASDETSRRHGPEQQIDSGRDLSR